MERAHLLGQCDVNNEHQNFSASFNLENYAEFVFLLNLSQVTRPRISPLVEKELNRRFVDQKSTVIFRNMKMFSLTIDKKLIITNRRTAPKSE